jgi:branched-subunit amino acid ABC-type transport system permease component
MLGAYIGLLVVGATGSFLLAILIAVVAVAIVGILMEAIVIRPVYDKLIEQILLTFGLAIIAEQLVKLIWGTRSLSFPTPMYLRGTTTVAGLSLSKYKLFTFVIGTLVILGLYVFLSRTKYGMVIQAGVEDAEMVEAVGLDVRKVFTLIFGLGAGLAALGGVIAAPQISVNPQMGVVIIIEAFIVVIIGGLGQFRGVVTASFLIGMMSGFGNIYYPQYTEMLLFLIVIAVLVIKPEGLFGSVHELEH